MKRIAAGALLMVVAIGLQLAMVVRVVEPSLSLGLAGYALLFGGVAVAVTGVVARRR